MTAAIVTTTATAIEPRDMGELRALAKAAAESKFYGAQTESQALVLLMTGRDLGLSYTQSLRAFDVIAGRAVLKPIGMVAICLRSPQCEYFETVDATNEQATVRTKRRGRPERVLTFTMEDAKRAKLDAKDNWRSYPSRMLLARAQAFLARDVYPDLLMGIYSDEEMEPAPPQRVDVEARRVPDAPPTPRSGTRHEPDFAALLGAATSAEELADIAAHMKVARLSPEERTALRPRYLEAKARCERMAAAVVAEVVNEDAEP